MTIASEPSVELAIHAAISSVDDPEYPGISIVDLGLLESVSIAPQGAVTIGLIPTFSGCPALAIIAGDVERAVARVNGVSSVEVTWLRRPAWTIERVSADARKQMAEEFTVAVQLGTRAPRCPRCDGTTTELSAFGPSRCRSVNRCTKCGEVVEVLRG